MSAIDDYIDNLDLYYEDEESEQFIELPKEIIYETPKAVMIKYRKRDVWLPKSKIYIEDDYILVPDWMLEEKI